MERSPARRPSIAQVFLGLFVSWQLLFLLTANYVGMVPHGKPEEGELSDSRAGPGPAEGDGVGQKVIDALGDITTNWAYLTGQVQSWWLFAPGFPEQATFPAVQLRWSDYEESVHNAPGTIESRASEAIPPVRLRTIIEPSDPQAYVRWPGSFDRLFHYEVRMGLIMIIFDEQSLAEHPDEWRELIENRVRRQWKSMRAYLRWYVLHYQEQHPELPPPKEAILLIRIYRSPGMGQQPVEWGRPVEQPLARWRLNEDQDSLYLPVEMFDPVERRFAGVKARD